MKSLLAVCLLGLASSAAAEFALKDGDTVVFLGDSITAARRYDRIIENYTLLRFPARRVTFFNAGKGGDTMTGALERLQREVFDRKATVLTVAFGVNDIGWGMKADAEHRAAYLKSLRTLIGRCQERNVRVFICSPAITSEDPDKAEQGFLQQMSDEGLALAKSLGAETIDIQRSMRAVQRRVLAVNEKVKDKAKHTKLHVEDGVHLNDLGQLAMAVAILKGLGAPAEVSAAQIDARVLKVTNVEGCTVSNLKVTNGGVTFDRLDEGYPLNFGTFGALNFRFVPVPAELNQYTLAVSGLAKGKYELRAGGRLLGTVTAQQLAAGLNISSMTADAWEPGGPWDAQAAALKMVTDARAEITGSDRYRERYLGTHAATDSVRTQTQVVLDALDKLQREYARPAAIHFEVKPASADAKEKSAR